MKNSCISENELKSVKELETPCFIINSQLFCDNVNELKKAMYEGFKSSILAYSVKTNALPYLLSLACACGLYAEVVSEDEYLLAKSVAILVFVSILI